MRRGIRVKGHLRLYTTSSSGPYSINGPIEVDNTPGGCLDGGCCGYEWAMAGEGMGDGGEVMREEEEGAVNVVGSSGRFQRSQREVGMRRVAAAAAAPRSVVNV